MEPAAWKTRRNVALFFLMLGIAAWTFPIPVEARNTFGIVMPLLALSMGFASLWKRAGERKDVVPDILGEMVGSYYEHNGLCFVPRLTVVDGLCWFNVYCQNRFDRACAGSICFVPMDGLCAAEPHDVPPLITDVLCDGGEVAIVSFPYPIAKGWQGKIMMYHVWATARYPIGRGRVLRSGSKGIPAPTPPAELSDTLKAAAWLAAGVVRVKGSTSCELRLPENVCDVEPAGAAQKTEVLWEMNRPTGGFPLE